MLTATDASRPVAERAFGPVAERAFGPGPVRAWLEHRRAQLPGSAVGSPQASGSPGQTGGPEPR